MLRVHRAERADALVAALADVLADPPADPLAPEVVAVPSRGMERWVSQRLATRLGTSPDRGDGACANVRFPSPARVVEEAVAAAAGVDPATDPWRPELSTWALLDVVEEALDEPWLALVAGHLRGAGDVPPPARRIETVRRLAGLFDRYAWQRPEMLRAWLDGRDVDADGGALRADATWQAELFRRLDQRIDAADLATRIATAEQRLREEPALVDLPARLSVFGLTRLPAGRLAVLRALAAHRELHVYALHPSPALWEKVRPYASAPERRRRLDSTASLPAHRLLASWGTDARELQLVFGAEGDADDVVHPVPDPPATLLGRLQAGIRADATPADPQPLAEDDRSIEVHACHGRGRQVEVLRDAVLRALADDPTLEPRDIIVMCPDVESFSPLIHATFGGGIVSGDDGPDLTAELRPPELRVRLADRALRQTNPILAALSALLELAGSRMTASAVLDFADRAPVRRRFGLSDDDLTRLREWIVESGTRWGLDARHRTPFRLESLAAGTFDSGFDRVLLGVAMAEDDATRFGETLPLDDVDSGGSRLAGRFTELIDRLRSCVDAFGQTRPVATWAQTLADALDAVATTRERDAWQRDELARVLSRLADDGAGSAADLDLAEVRALLAESLRGRPTRANFRTGALTVCTLVPMRSVPHRVVCLLGLDDEAFPRKAPRDGDDLTLAEPHVGERDPRLEDRQLLLDAVLAAEDRLIVTYAGRDERTNALRPAAVPIEELLDEIDNAVTTADGSPRDHVVVKHPLQPFDPRTFTPGCLVPGGAAGFDPVSLEGARRLLEPRAPHPPFAAAPLPAKTPPLVELDALVRFTDHPVRAFLRQRLGLSLYEQDDAVEDVIPLDLDNLQRWKVGDRVLRSLLTGIDRTEAILAERGRGTLPPGELGRSELAEILPGVDAIAAAVNDLFGSDRPGSQEARVVLPDDRVVSGTVHGVCGDLTRFVTYARLGPKQRLGAWVRVLLLSAALPENPWASAAVGREGDDGVSIARIGPLGEDPAERAELATHHLGVLVDLYDRGLREPLPIFSKTSAAWAQAVRRGRDPLRDADAAWTSKGYDKEDREPEHQLVLGGVVSLEDLTAFVPAVDEQGPDWLLDPSRLGRLACRLWDGLLDHEKVETR